MTGTRHACDDGKTAFIRGQRHGKRTMLRYVNGSLEYGRGMATPFRRAAEVDSKARPERLPQGATSCAQPAVELLFWQA